MKNKLKVMKYKSQLSADLSGSIYKTHDYSRFVMLKPNRAISKTNVGYIRDSIVRNGYCGAGIIVNEKFEIIDGQHRFAACMDLELPIKYEVIQGLTILDVAPLNTHQKNWSVLDHIDSYAAQGNTNYQRLLKLQSMFNKTSTLLKLVSTYPKPFWRGGKEITVTKCVKCGEFIMDARFYVEVYNVIELINTFSFFKYYTYYSFVSAFMTCVKTDDFDFDHLRTRLRSRPVQNQVSSNQWLVEIQRIYNIGRHSPNRIFLDIDF